MVLFSPYSSSRSLSVSLGARKQFGDMRVVVGPMTVSRGQ